MDTVTVIVTLTGALELIPDGDLELGSVDIFKYEAGPAGDANQVKLLSALKEHLDFLLLQLFSFLFV